MSIKEMGHELKTDETHKTLEGQLLGKMKKGRSRLYVRQAGDGAYLITGSALLEDGGSPWQRVYAEIETFTALIDVLQDFISRGFVWREPQKCQIG